MSPAGRTIAACWVVVSAAVPVDRCQAGPSAGDEAEPQLEFQVLGARENLGDSALTVERVAPGEAVLRGTIATPTPCYGIAAELAARERTLTVTLTATAQPGICITVLAAFAYQARIYGLSAGRYTIDVVYTYPGTGWNQQVKRVELEIP